PTLRDDARPNRQGRRPCRRRPRASRALGQAVERSEGAERLQRGAAILCLRPARSLLGGHHPSEHELAVARTDDLVREPAEILGGQIAKRRARRLVVLVLEPGETLHATEHGADLWRALLPRRRPPLLVRVLGTDLEEEAHAVAGDRDLEVSVLLVPATVRREGHPCVVGRIDGPPCMLGDVDERLVAGGALDGRSQAMAERLELGP